MSIALGCIGDDYTGSSDLANALTRAGLRTIQTIGTPDLDVDADAVVIALKSRSIEPADAVAMARKAKAWLDARGATHILFKICSTFDSTDKGNIGPVMDALRAVNDGVTLVNSSFPEAKRTIYRGHLFVGDALLSDSPLKDHPLNPMHDANLVRVLSRQSRTKIGLIPLEIVAKGSDAIAARMSDLAAEHYGAAIVDTVSDRNLDAIGAAALTTRLSVGASGLGIGLARALISQGVAAKRSVASAPPAIGGPIAALSGSCSQATLEQVARASAWGAVLQLDGLALAANPEAEAQRVIAWAKVHLAQGPVLIASSAPPVQVQSLQAQFGREEGGRAIEDGMARIAAGLVEAGVRRLIVAGGETSGAIVDRLGLKAFAIGPEIAPGVPVLSTIGDQMQMTLALKSGNFGGLDFFADAAKMMP